MLIPLLLYYSTYLDYTQAHFVTLIYIIRLHVHTFCTNIVVLVNMIRVYACFTAVCGIN